MPNYLFFLLLRKWENLAFEDAKLEEAGKTRNVLCGLHALKISTAPGKLKKAPAMGRHPAQLPASPQSWPEHLHPLIKKQSHSAMHSLGSNGVHTPSPKALGKSEILPSLRSKSNVPGKKQEVFFSGKCRVLWRCAVLESNTEISLS